jgi:hypothetical protein
MTRRSLLSATVAIAVTDVEPKPRDRFARANENVRELMLLLDTDNHGRISKPERLNFLEAEFNRSTSGSERHGGSRVLPRDHSSTKPFMR